MKTKNRNALKGACRLIAVLIALTTMVLAQPQPQTAHVNLYFPHIADGGPTAAQWQTSFGFTNTSNTRADVQLLLFESSGAPFLVDLGSGAKSDHRFTIPAYGSVSFRSQLTNPTTKLGWAVAWSTVPIQGTSSFRLYLNGKAVQEVTAPPTLPTLQYYSYANRELGVAIANPSPSKTTAVNLTVADKSGSIQGASTRVTLPPLGHTAFNVKDKFPFVDMGDWTLEISAVDEAADFFLSWTMNADVTGTFSSIPSGAIPYPLSHADRIELVFYRLLAAAHEANMLSRPGPRLEMLRSKNLNAYASPQDVVYIELSVSELISDSESELAFVVAHELAHIMQFRAGRVFEHPNPEFDADILGTRLALFAGYDPYAAAGALAKLSMASGEAGFMDQWEDHVGPEVHKSFNDRLEAVFESLRAMCNGNPQANDTCRRYKRIYHPHLPDVSPLSQPNGTAPTSQQ